MFFYWKIVNDSTFVLWNKHGGNATIKSLGEKTTIDNIYVDFVQASLPYYELNDKGVKRLFVHAGVPEACCKEGDDGTLKLEDVNPEDFLWTRDTAHDAYNHAESPDYAYGDKYDKIYLGHTPTQKLNMFYSSPQHWGNIWLMDTGGCFKGKLSIINIDTEEIWQSKSVASYYPSEKGRNEKSYNENLKT